MALGMSERLLAAEAALAAERRRTEALNRIALSIGAGGSLENVVQAVVDGGVELTHARFGAFFYNVVDTGGESYTLYILSGAPREAFASFPMPRNTQVFAPTFEGRGVVRSPDIVADPRYGHSAPYHGMPEGHLPVRSYLAAPVIGRSGEVLGGLFFGHPDTAVFDDASEAVLVGLAAQAAVAIETVRLHRDMARELEERRRSETRHKLLLNELNHRVKNTLATVQSIAYQTQRSARTPVDFRNAFEARLMALSQTHNLLTEQGWQGAGLAQLLEAEFEPYDTESGRFIFEGGPALRLSPKAAVAIGMAAHELVTNAAKYGALSNARGSVSVGWSVSPDPQPILTLTWTERDGPTVNEPEHRGFGRRLLEQGLANELSGEVAITYDPAGLHCVMRLPLRSLEPDE
jgi:two-component sensor histidine kinase